MGVVCQARAGTWGWKRNVALRFLTIGSTPATKRKSGTWRKPGSLLRSATWVAVRSTGSMRLPTVTSLLLLHYYCLEGWAASVTSRASPRSLANFTRHPTAGGGDQLSGFFDSFRSAGCSGPSLWTAAGKTVAPASPSAIAIHRPAPRVTPATSAILPFKLSSALQSLAVTGAPNILSGPFFWAARGEAKVSSHARIIEAANAAVLWSLVQGGPIELPRLEIPRCIRFAAFPNAAFARSSSSRSLIGVTGIFKRSQAFLTVLRKNSPSAVWISACDARIFERGGRGRPEAKRTARPTTR